MQKLYPWLMLTFSIFFFQSFVNAQSVLDPADPIVEYSSSRPPTQPPAGQIGKWVRTKRLPWNTDSYKAYIYNGFAFRLKFPKTYDPTANDGKKYPMIIFFHGRGEVGPITDNEYQLLHGGTNFATAVDNGTFDGYVLFMQSQGNWLSGHFQAVKFIIDYMVKNNKLDLFRVYDNGLSAGGQATWKFMLKYPTYITAALPMSGVATSFASSSSINKLKFTPIWNFQGGKDVNPTPATARTVRDLYSNAGGNYTYTEYADLGHGTWDRAWSEPDFFPFMNRAYKSDPWPLGGRTEFCKEDNIAVTIGVTPGFKKYEWMKSGQLLSATSNTVLATDTGTYSVRVQSGSTWSYWSHTPVVIKYKEGTVTPPISLASPMSNVIPSPDKSYVNLEVPDNGYTRYIWKRTDNDSVFGTQRTLKVTEPGDYIVSVAELYGCSSNFSPAFTVIDANGQPKPDPATNLAAYTVSNTAIELDWSNNPHPVYNETAFEIYRSSASGPYLYLGQVQADVLQFIDNAAVPNTKYSYVVRAINNTGASAVSNVATVQSQSDGTPPTAPGNVRITAQNSYSVTLSWDPSTDNAGIAKYFLYINDTLSYSTSATSYTINGLSPLQQYSFYIKARDVSGNYSNPSNQVSTATALQGLQYKYYEGSWSTLPDFNTLTPVKTGTGSNVDISVRNRDDQFGFVWQGYIKIPVSGTYTFETYSDDGSRLWLGSYNATATPLVDNDGAHAAQYKGGTVTLQAGTYPISIAFFEQGGDQVMQVYWTSAQAFGNNTRRLIADEYFSDTYTPDGTPPAMPLLSAVTAESYNKISIEWTDKSNNETAFEIYRSTAADGPFNIVGRPEANATSFADTTVSPSTTYYYKVQAVNKYGASGFNATTTSTTTTAGLSYSYYEGTWNKLPDFNTLTPVKTGVVNNVTLSVANRSTNYALKFEGTITIPTSGYYTFYTRSDDGSNLYIGGFSSSNIVVNNDYTQSATERSGTKYLNSGTYPYYVTYFQQGGDVALTTSVSGTTFGKIAIPDNILSTTVTSTTEVRNYATTAALPPAPAAPASLAATALSSSEVNLSWMDVADNEVSYEVYRSLGDDTKFRLLATIPANSTSYKDSSLFGNVTYYYKITVNGAGGTSTTTSPVSAKTKNNAPVISKLSDRSVPYGTATVINIKATDADGENLSFSMSNQPSFATLVANGDNSATLTLTPGVNDANVYNNVSVTVNDGNGGADATSFNLTVNDNYYPVMDSIVDYTVRENDDLNIPLNANDLNSSDVINWTVSSLPFEASVNVTTNRTATLLLKPSLASAGVYPVTVTASDGNGGVVTRAFMLTVNDRDPNQKIYVRFKDETSAGAPWNEITGTTTNNLVDAEGKATDVNLAFQTDWWAVSNAGPQTGDNSGVYPDAVLRDYYYFGMLGGPESVSVKITGLNKNTLYNLNFYAGSSWTGTSRNGTTIFKVGQQTVSLDVQDNTQNTVSIDSIKPNWSGEITFVMRKGKKTDIGYINALTITALLDDGAVPASPSNLIAKNTQSGGVALAWQDIGYTESGYEIFRSTSADGTFESVGKTGANITSFIDSSAAGFTSYYYKARGFNKYGNSDYSNTAMVTTINRIPQITPISNVVVKNDQSATINVVALDDKTDKIRLTAGDLPSFATFKDNGDGTGVITVNPSVNSIGLYPGITVTATDSYDSSRSASFDLSVTDKNVSSVFINFTNGSEAPAPWNNVTGVANAGRVVGNLVDESNKPTGLALTFVEGFTGVSAFGMRPGNGKGAYPEVVMRTGEYESSTTTTNIKISGLDQTKKYNFVFFNSHDDGTNGLTNFTINGQTISLNARYNLEKTGQINGIAPDANGEVNIGVSKDAQALNAYLNALVIQMVNNDVSPLGPTDLKVTGVTRNTASLIWADRASDETGYEVWRATGQGSFTRVATLGANTTSFNDANLQAKTTYYYSVRAVKSSTYSDYSNVATANTNAYAIYINFSSDNTAPAPWNNTATTPLIGYVWSNFLDELSQPTNVGMVDLTDFAGVRSNEMNTGNNSGVVPDKVMMSGYVLYPGQSGGVKLKGLNLNMQYNLTFFGSSVLTGDVNTSYTVNGKTVLLNTSLNTTGTVTVYNVTPDDNGEITITVAPGTATAQLGMISALIVEAFASPSGATPQPGGVNRTTQNQSELQVSVLDKSDRGSRISAFPNPFTDHFTLAFKAQSNEKVQVKLYDVSGKLVYFTQTDVVAGDNVLEVRPAGVVAPGICFVDVALSNEGKSRTIKLLKGK